MSEYVWQLYIFKMGETKTKVNPDTELEDIRKLTWIKVDTEKESTEDFVFVTKAGEISKEQ